MKSLSLTKPHVIAVVGIPGSGKTFFAEKFADTFHAPYVNRGKIFALTGGSAPNTDNLMHYQLDELLKTQQSVIIEGAADTRAARLELAKKARGAGYEVLLIWVQTDPATAKTRALKAVKDREDGPIDDAAYDRQAARFVPPTAPEKPVVISGRHTYASQAKAVLQRLSAPRAAISTHNTAPTRADSPVRRNITIR